MQDYSLIIIGGGGHTRVLIGMLKTVARPITGILTRDASLLEEMVHEVPVLGLEDSYALDAAHTHLINGVGNKATRSSSGLVLREQLFSRYKARGFSFAQVISEHAVIQPDVMLGEGVQVMPGAVVQPGAMVGENSIINTCASIDHDVVIYPHAHIAPGAVLCGDVVVGERTHVGAGAVVIQGIRIGSDVIIGAGAVITRNVPDGAVILPSPSEHIVR